MMRPGPDPWLVVLAGLPGTGKTTLSKTLAAETGARHLRVDTIEAALKLSAAQWDGDLADAGYQVLKALAVEDLGRGTSVIIDCVNPIALARTMWEGLAPDRTLRIELTCSDSAEHRSRVEGRKPDLPGQTLPTWAEVKDRCYIPWLGANLRFDTGQQSLTSIAETIYNTLP